ncbi:Tox-REase-5 domain-containing protein [Atlantibacter hermannii]|nr:Tox-REase-5 domain-containing protein [Atlantibacter hermannii]
MAVSAETHGDYWEDDMDYSETVSYEGVEVRAGAQAKPDDKTCENCPPEGKVMPMVRRCSRWSRVTINYQTRICGTFYNPETKQIQEFKYCGVSFDGWKDKLCQFQEAKARYDQFFRADGSKKRWWTGNVSAINQASRHQAIATINQPLKVVWIFMQPLSREYFKKMFKDYKDVITRWQP